FFQAEDGIRDLTVTGVQTCALPIWFLLAERGVILLIAVVGASVVALFVASMRSRLEAEQRRTATLLASARVLADAGAVLDRSLRSEERRVGKEWRSGWVADPGKRTG